MTVERSADAYAIVATGVRPGDDVVTDGQSRLVSGAQVEIKSGAGGAGGTVG